MNVKARGGLLLTGCSEKAALKETLKGRGSEPSRAEGTALQGKGNSKCRSPGRRCIVCAQNREEATRTGGGGGAEGATEIRQVGRTRYGSGVVGGERGHGRENNQEEWVSAWGDWRL